MQKKMIDLKDKFYERNLERVERIELSFKRLETSYNSHYTIPAWEEIIKQLDIKQKEKKPIRLAT
tara:strand:- start:4175 stop:4369 length:195 start_codon:yes stop_codon:yes gene_type:complete